MYATIAVGYLKEMSQLADGVKMTSYRRGCDVITSQRRVYNVILTSYALWGCTRRHQTNSGTKLGTTSWNSGRDFLVPWRRLVIDRHTSCTSSKFSESPILNLHKIWSKRIFMSWCFSTKNMPQKWIHIHAYSLQDIFSCIVDFWITNILTNGVFLYSLGLALRLPAGTWRRNDVMYLMGLKWYYQWRSSVTENIWFKTCFLETKISWNCYWCGNSEIFEYE